MVLCFGYPRRDYGMFLLDSAAGDHMGSPLRLFTIERMPWALHIERKSSWSRLITVGSGP